MLKILNILFIFCTMPITFSGQLSCYLKYKTKADEAKQLNQFDIAIKQYQAVKQCDSVSLEKLNTIDSLIDLTYHNWVEELKHDKKLANDSYAESLIKQAADAAIEGDIEKAFSEISLAPDKTNSKIRSFLSDIAPYKPDLSISNVLALDSFYYNSSSYIVLIQTTTRPKNKIKSINPARISGTSSKDEDHKMELQNDSLVLRIFETTETLPREVYAHNIAPVGISNRKEFKFVRINDTLKITTPSVNYSYKIPAHMLLKFDENLRDSVINLQSICTPEDFINLQNRLAPAGIKVSATGIKFIENNYSSLCELSFIETASENKNLSISNTEKIELLDSMNRLLIVNKNLSDSSYTMQVFTIVPFALVDVIKHLAQIPEIHYSDYAGLLSVSLQDTLYKDSSRMPILPDQHKRPLINLIYNVGTLHLISNFAVLAGPYINLYSLRKIKDGFLGKEYSSTPKLWTFNQNLDRKKFYLLGNSSNYEYDPVDNKLLIVKSNNRNVNSIKQKFLHFFTDTLTIFYLNSGDSLIFTGGKIQVIDDSIVTIIRDSSIEILNFARLGHQRIAYKDNIEPIDISGAGKYLSIRYKGDLGNETDTTTSIFSLRNSSMVLSLKKIIAGDRPNSFLCTTGNTRLQEYYYLDTFSNSFEKIILNLSRENIPPGKMYYNPSKKFFYFIENRDGLEEPNSDASAADIYKNFLTGDSRGLMKFLPRCALNFYYPNVSGKRMVNVLNNVDQINNLKFVGNLLIIKAPDSIFYDKDEIDSNAIFGNTFLLFKISPTSDSILKLPNKKRRTVL